MRVDIRMTFFSSMTLITRNPWGQRLGADNDQILKITNCIRTT